MTHKIELKSLSELLPNPMNPKAHDEELLNKSIQSFGYVEPIVLDGRTGMMVSGHGRKEALQRLFDSGAEPPEGITVKNKQWLIPVITGWSSKDDDEAKGVLVALNRTTERGGWDDNNLLAILQDLADTDILDSIGYKKTDIAVLEKILEANDVFTMDVSAAIDEFLDDTGMEGERIGLTYSSVLRVYFQTEDARQEFFDQIGYKNNEKQKTIRYPKSFEKQASETWTG